MHKTEDDEANGWGTAKIVEKDKEKDNMIFLNK